MKREQKQIVDWMDRTLRVRDFEDVSNNGLQIDRRGTAVTAVAFAVDGSLRTIHLAAEAGAQMLVVHHGISWGGGIKRLTGGVFNVVQAAIEANISLYACHLPLDAHPTLGNNAVLARELKLKNTKPAFNYHGNVIGLVGTDSHGRKIGVCSGGAASFAEDAQELGCVKLVTGEANWGEVIAAKNCGMELDCRGHYSTEVGGVRALAKAMAKALKVRTIDLTEE